MLACHLPLSFLVIYVVYCRWVLTTTRNTFNSWPTPTQLLALFGHGLHPRISCLSLVTTYTQATLASHWSRPTPMQFLPIIGHGLHPRNSCLSLVTAYIHATLASLWSRPTPTQLLPLIGHGLHPRNAYLSLVTSYTHARFVSGIISLILHTAGCICQQYPLDSSQVKVIYNILSLAISFHFGNAVDIASNFLVHIFIYLHSSFNHFKNGTLYLSRETTQIFFL